MIIIIIFRRDDGQGEGREGSTVKDRNGIDKILTRTKNNKHGWDTRDEEDYPVEISRARWGRITKLEKGLLRL